MLYGMRLTLVEETIYVISAWSPILNGRLNDQFILW